MCIRDRSSTVLNVDVNSLADEAKGSYYGYIPTSGGVTLLGQSSGAQATVTDVRLVADTFGDLFGTFFFENPLSDPAPSLRFKTGTSTFTLSSSPINEDPNIGSALISSGGTEYVTNGTINTIKSTTVTVRVPPPIFYRPSSGGQKHVITNKFKIKGYQKMTVSAYRKKMAAAKKSKANFGSGKKGGFGTGTNGKGRPSGSPLGTYPGRNIVGIDPLSQTFRVDQNGAFLTSVDLFFARKDPNENLTVEIRTTELGTPTSQLVQDFARAVVNPNDINISDNGEAATRVTFPSPVYLEGGEEYALVLGVTQSINYEVWISRMGERTVNTQTLPDAESVIVTKQYIGGSLFKSQNGSIWTPSQYQDLTFKLRKAEFVPSGTVTFYNSNIGAGYNTQVLSNNPIRTLPRKLRVKLAGSAADTSGPLAVGRKVSTDNGTGNANSAEDISVTGIVEARGANLASSGGTNANTDAYELVSGGSGYSIDDSGTVSSTGTISGLSLIHI